MQLSDFLTKPVTLAGVVTVLINGAIFGLGLWDRERGLVAEEVKQLTSFEERLAAQQRRVEQVETDNNKADRNAQAIVRIEEKMREIGSAPTSENVGKAILRVTVLQQRITELENKVANLSNGSQIEGTLDTDAIATQVETQLVALVDKAVAEKLSDAGAVSGTDLQADVIAARVFDSDESVEKDGILWEFQRCYTGSQWMVLCEIKVTNQTREDKKACFSDLEIVTDTGQQFDKNDHQYLYIGSARSTKSVCTNVPPLVTINAVSETAFHDRYKEKIALLRYNCGVGCQMAVYDKPISQ